MRKNGSVFSLSKTLGNKIKGLTRKKGRRGDNEQQPFANTEKKNLVTLRVEMKRVVFFSNDFDFAPKLEQRQTFLIQTNDETNPFSCLDYNYINLFKIQIKSCKIQTQLHKYSDDVRQKSNYN